MKIRVGTSLNISSSDFKLITICPHCGAKGTFDYVSATLIGNEGDNPKYCQLEAGLARCPNPECFGLVYYALNRFDNKFLDVYPKTRIDFNPENIPQRINKSFIEAITCHANGCLTASAIMVRKTLEEICHEKNATGANLYKRIESLKSIVTLPKALMDGIQDLRLIGNDAAHVDLETFPQIGNEELDIAMEFTIELLKAIYQHERLLLKLQRLKNKKSQDTQNPPDLAKKS